jgi:hypothetical protein
MVIDWCDRDCLDRDAVREAVNNALEQMQSKKSSLRSKIRGILWRYYGYPLKDGAVDSIMRAIEEK